MVRKHGERIRPDRVAEQVRIEVAKIVQHELKDPRLGLVTCTRVQMSNDLRNATVYVSILGDENCQAQTMDALKGAIGYIRRLLSQRLVLRISPEISFVYDPSIEYSIRLEELFDETRSEVGEEGIILENNEGSVSD